MTVSECVDLRKKVNTTSFKLYCYTNLQKGHSKFFFESFSNSGR